MRSKKSEEKIKMHKELLTVFNFVEKDSDTNIFKKMSEYNVVYDDLKNIKFVLKREQTKFFTYAISIDNMLGKYAKDFNADLIKIKKIDLINYILYKLFYEYTQEELVDLLRNHLDRIEELGGEIYKSCSLEREIYNKIVALKKAVKQSAKFSGVILSAHKIMSFLLEYGAKKYLPKRNIND